MSNPWLNGILPEDGTDEAMPVQPATATQLVLGDALNAEDLTEKSNVAEANTILMEGRVGLADTSRGILVAGRAFNRLKPMFPKGTWLPRLKMEAERSGHSIRSIQEYMKAAKEDDAKNAELRVFAKSTDPQAVALTEAGEQAKQRVADAITATELTDTTEPKTKKPPRKSPVRLDGIYRLPLPMTGDEKDATDELMQSPNWPNAQRYMMEIWRQVLVGYGYFVVPEAAPETRTNADSFLGVVAIDADTVPSIFPGEAGDGARTQA